MSLYSYHVFMFPFQWELKDGKEKAFSERFHINRIAPLNGSNWKNISTPTSEQYQTELYNEKNFFYKFVHNALYDNGSEEQPVIRHYERNEAYTGELSYEIGIKAYNNPQVFRLNLKSICLDLFSTGTGILIFYLENRTYPKIEDVKRINQYGRRVFPPFLTVDKGVEGTKESELADYICINGLNSEPHRYYEDFTGTKPSDFWGNARFIKSLIEDLDPNISLEPVIDDRMFTMCWYLNNEISAEIKNDRKFCEFVINDKWHEFLYIDSYGSTCKNSKMQKELLKEHTYPRWQKYGTLYGVTRHSFMAISEEGPWTENVLVTYFRTMYVRIAELALLQRASVLKFSAEVTRLSTLPDADKQTLADDIDKFYKAYIRFVNQIYFREISAQEQGIDLYDKITESMRIKEQVKDLDDEIEELHNYATLLDEKAQSRNIGLLTILGSLFLIPSFIVGFYGMNLIPDSFKDKNWLLILTTAVIIFVALGLFRTVQLNMREKRRTVKILIWLISAVIVGSISIVFFYL